MAYKCKMPKNRNTITNIMIKTKVTDQLVSVMSDD